MPVFRSAASLSTIMNSSPTAGAKPLTALVSRATLLPIVTAPVTASWSWSPLVMPGLVPPISTVKVSLSAKMKFPATSRMPGDVPGDTSPSRISVVPVKSRPAVFVSPIAAPLTTSSVPTLAGLTPAVNVTSPAFAPPTTIMLAAVTLSSSPSVRTRAPIPPPAPRSIVRPMVDPRNATVPVPASMVPYRPMSDAVIETAPLLVVTTLPALFWK